MTFKMRPQLLFFVFITFDVTMVTRVNNPCVCSILDCLHTTYKTKSEGIMAFLVSRVTLNDETNCAFIFTVTITAAQPC